MKIVIGIVQYGEEKLLENCTKSLGLGNSTDHRISDKVTLELRVWDNNKYNLGFTQGHNNLIWPMDYDIYWCLNNDTIIPAETLEYLKSFEREDGVGIIGHKIVSMDDPDFIHHAGTGSCFPAGVHKSGSVRLGQFTEPSYEKWVTFASVMIHKSVFGIIGAFDSHFVNYFSDSDFCYRARYAGFKIKYDPKIVVQHKIGQSQNPSPEQLEVIMRDSNVFQNKWMNGKAFFDLDKELIV